MKFKIDSINRVIIGTRQRILNLDYTDENGIKHKNVTFFTHDEKGTITNSTYPETMHPDSAFSYNQYTGKNTNEFGYVFINHPMLSSHVIRSLYDAKDVMFKSSTAKQLTNKTTTEFNDEVNIEIYAPHLLKNPIGFAQLNDYAYGLTDKTQVSPVFRNCNFDSFNSQTTNTQIVWTYFTNPYDKEGSTEHDPSTIENLIPTYTYTPLSSLQTISDIPISSYYNYLELSGAESLSNLFKPVNNFEHIDYNYLLELPLRKGYPETNQYRNATVNADIFLAKNAYNELYSMQLSSSEQINNLRSYNSINSCGNGIFLTYFSEGNILSSTPSSSQNSNNTFKNFDDYSLITDVDGTQEDIKQYDDYMHVEFIDSINRFISTTSHKSNLFKTRIYGFEKIADKNPGSELNDLKKKIKNSINKILNKYIPAHTQMFSEIEFASTKKDQQC